MKDEKKWWSLTQEKKFENSTVICELREGDEKMEEQKHKFNEDAKSLLLVWLKRVAEGKTTSDAEIAILPEVLKTLLLY